VVSTPLKHIRKSEGLSVIIPYIMENKKCLKPPTKRLFRLFNPQEGQTNVGSHRVQGFPMLFPWNLPPCGKSSWHDKIPTNRDQIRTFHSTQRTMTTGTATKAGAGPFGPGFASKAMGFSHGKIHGKSHGNQRSKWENPWIVQPCLSNVGL